MLLCFEEGRKSFAEGLIGRKKVLCKKQLVKNEVRIYRPLISDIFHLLQSEQFMAQRRCCDYA